MTLDDRLTNYYRETVRVDGNTPNSRQRATQAILSDLLEIIGEDEEITITDPDTNGFGKVVGHPYNDLRQELRDKVKEYCK